MCYPCWPWAEIYLEDKPKEKKKKSVPYYDPVSKMWVKVEGVPKHHALQLHNDTSIMVDQTEQNFQPQTRDTTNGPNVHTYIPRSDSAAITVNGVTYWPEGQGPASTANATAAAATIPVMIQPGQPATVPMVPYGVQAPINYPVPITQPQVAYLPQQYPYQPGVYGTHIQQPAFGTIGLTGSEVLSQQLQTAQGLKMDEAQDMKPEDDDKHRFYWVRELDNTWTQRSRMTIDSGDIGDCRWYAKDGIFYAVRLPMS